MDFLKKNYILHFLPCLIPAVFSILAVVTGYIGMYVVTVLSVFALVGFVPFYKRRESLWMFLLVAIGGTPINIGLILAVVQSGILDFSVLIGKILWCFLLYSSLFSLEEILFGVITRFIWKRQYKLKL